MVLQTEHRAKSKKEKIEDSCNWTINLKKILVPLLLNCGIEGNLFNVSKIQFMPL